MRKQPDVYFHSPFEHNSETVAFDERFGSNIYPDKYHPIRICNTYANPSKQKISRPWRGALLSMGDRFKYTDSDYLSLRGSRS